MIAKKLLNKIIKINSLRKRFHSYFKNFKKYSFVDGENVSFEQYEASIIRQYHIIEKGLSYENYRAGFGRNNIEKLLFTLEQYTSKFDDVSSFSYRTAISCLDAYIKKNREFGLNDIEIEERFHRLQGEANNLGGVIAVSKPKDNSRLSFEELLKARHSIRHFSDVPVDIVLLIESVKLAQYTPSACNRQGWKTRIVADKDKISTILANQNGNRGFGQEIDKLLIITADLRAQQRNRELFQAFIDGGMYATNVLNALFAKGIGSVPLSAALTPKQEDNIRRLIKISDAEVLILFIGVGNYPEGEILTTRSERKTINVEVM